MNINLSKFKKVHSDEHTTTLSHPSGHSFTIAHKGLSPEMHQELKSLPNPQSKSEQNQDSMMLARGGKVSLQMNSGAAAQSQGISNNPKLQESKKLPHYAGGGVGGNVDPEKGKQVGHGAGATNTSPPPAEEPELNTFRTGESQEGLMSDEDSDKDQAADIASKRNPQHKAHGGMMHQAQMHSGMPKAPDAHAGAGSPIHIHIHTGSELKSPEKPHYATAGAVEPAPQPGQDPDDALSGAVGPGPAGAPDNNPLPPQEQAAAEQAAQMPQDQAAPQPDQTPSQDNQLNPKNQQAVQGIKDQEANIPPPGDQGTDYSSPAPPPTEQDNVAQQQAQDQQAQQQDDVNTHQAKVNEMMSENAKWEQDLANQHITPETMHSLFAKKDLIPKLTTLFGMLLGGATSVNGGDNPVVKMMQQQIQNDFEAQKQSKANAQNILRITQRSGPDINGIAQLTQEGKLTHAQAQNIAAEAETRNYALANMHHNSAALASMVQELEKISTTPQRKAQIQQQLAILYPALQAENYSLADRAAAASAYFNPQSQTGPASGTNSPIDYQKMNQLGRNSQLKIPGSPTEADMSQMTKEANQVTGIRSVRENYQNAFNKLQQMVGKGTFSPNQRAAYIATLGAQLAHETTGRYTPVEAAMQMNGMFPNKTDIGKETANVKLSQGLKFFDNEEAKSSNTLNRWGVKNPPPGPAKNTPTKTDANGVKWIQGPNGSAIKAQ